MCSDIVEWVYKSKSHILERKINKRDNYIEWSYNTIIGVVQELIKQSWEHCVRIRVEIIRQYRDMIVYRGINGWYKFLLAWQQKNIFGCFITFRNRTIIVYVLNWRGYE